MYEHMVFFKFSKAVTAETLQGLANQLLAFKGHIPGIVELTAGLNVTEEKECAQGYTLGLRVTFETKEALDGYGPHPVHQEFVRSLDGICENVIVVDYPIA